MTLVLLGLGVLMGSWRFSDLAAEREQAAHLDRIATSLQDIEAFAKFTTGAPWFSGEQVPGAALGPERARVHIVEFGDYQCEFCAVVVDSLDDYVATGGDSVKLSFVHYPSRDSLSRPHSRTAALGGLCAEEAGAFWAYHRAVYHDQEALASRGRSFVTEVLKRTAAMPEAEVERCLGSSVTESRLDAHIKLGNRLLVSATPTFFVNGRRFVGSRMELLRAASGFEHRRLRPATEAP